MTIGFDGCAHRSRQIGRPLQVRLVTWDDDPPLGGQGVYVRDLRSALNDRGLQVSTVAGNGQFAMPYRRLTGRAHLDMSIAINRSTRVLTTCAPDVVHLSGGPGGLQLLRSLSVPVVYTAHHTFRAAHNRFGLRRLYGRVEALSYSRAAMVAAVSESTATLVVQMGVPPERVVVIPPGVRTVPDATSGIESESGRMLFVGRLEPEKGPLDAVAVMDAVASTHPGARGFVVGQGSLKDEVSRSASLTRGRVSFLGSLDDAELSLQYRRAQVVVMPSAYEGVGLVALEAMAAGAVVVGYDVIGLRETLDSGVVVPYGDVAALGVAVRRVLTDGGLCRELVAKSRETLREGYSWGRTAAQFEELYREVITAHDRAECRRTNQEAA